MDGRFGSDFAKAMICFGVAVGLILGALAWAGWWLLSHLRIGWH